MNTSNRKWIITLVENVGEDYYDGLYDLSIQLKQHYSKQIKEMKIGDSPEEFLWFRECATRPAFHHLCFSYKAVVYSCLIGKVTDNKISISSQDWDNNQRETKRYGLQPCIIPLESNEEDKSIRVLPILDANTLEPIDFKREYIDEPLSEWELYSLGVNIVKTTLENDNCTDVKTCDIPDITPSIWFTDPNGVPSYIIVRSIPIGCNEEPYTINKNMVDRLAKQGISGYFANISWYNLFGASGMYNEKQVFHSSLKISESGVEPIEDVEKNHANIIFVDGELYDIKP